jgi:archaellum biogenesis ATPase FlaH
MQKESDIQKQIFNYCTKIADDKNIVFFSIPNESLMTALRMFKIDSKTSAMLTNHFKSMGLLPGIPDTCLLYSGKTYFFELKRQNSDAGILQKIVHEKIRRTGHDVFIVKSLDEFILKLIEIGVV